ncbi:MAG: glucosaminidase domain-containing protein [Muribaculaceae bacterium]|nr:glucosaminidase domain-containing protein [Muribaculaceae bacterium]
MAFSAISASAQTKHQRYLDYIERYKHVALQSEREYGIPASITLAQGLLESYVGQSKMAKEANNHFGIKAYHWKGEVYGACDSLKQVGYRKYGAPEDSFLDHAKFLKGPRYSILYEFDVTDYRSWAQGLRDCGYAEDENYPTKLINIIEQYELYALDGGKRMDGSKASETAIEEDAETTDNGRWYHRKRRNHGQQEASIAQDQEHPAANPPARPGRVLASADND